MAARRLMVYAVALACAAWSLAGARAGPSLVETVGRGVTVVRDDNGAWAADCSKDITHQVEPAYTARKTLDLSAVPEALWARVRAVRISALFMVRDYSRVAGGTVDGLDEAYQVIVNGRVHTYPTSGGPTPFAEGAPQAPEWFDHDIPPSELRRGPNEVLIRKAPGRGGYDDYLYLCIDLTAHRGHSAVAFDGSSWRTDALTVPGGSGEYMVRAYLVTESGTVAATWRPHAAPALEDPDGIIGYAGPTVGAAADGSVRLEWNPAALDAREPVEVSFDGSADAEMLWLDGQGNPTGEASRGGRLALQAGGAPRPGGVLLRRLGQAGIRSVTLRACRALRPPPAPIDPCPPMAAPFAIPKPRPPSAVVGRSGATLLGSRLDARFEAGGRLRLVSLRNRVTGTEMLRAGAPPLFTVMVDGRRYSGSGDFRLLSMCLDGAGLRAELALADPPLRAELTAHMEPEGLRLGLNLRPAGSADVAASVVFPHLEGLAASPDPRDDRYFYPLGGGIMAGTPSLVRAVYGDHQALYQVMDLHSPTRGGGLYLRVDDAQGMHKALTLRKAVAGLPEVNCDRVATLTREEFRGANPLSGAPGVGMAVEYSLRTRAPGAAFPTSPALLAAHPGDWHEAMEAYAAWAHRAWRFRPMGSRLRSVHTMTPRGWSTDQLFRDGAYRSDLVDPALPGVGRSMTDCLELMSWWDWSPLGPLGAPMDNLAARLTPEQVRACEPYLVRDPVTGARMWNNQPGDYAGYNDRFGGLPAFRRAVEGWKRQGALVTPYTDPFRFDEFCPLGRQVGDRWGVVGVDGKVTHVYDVLNPCHYVPEVRRWVADTMERVLRETGADGLRLDEYGHMGWACFSPAHRHTWAEPGVSQWNKAVAETTAEVRRRMDRIRPGLVLTTEHPGYDYLMRSIDGCITYDLTVQSTPLRPLECNLQRFYFPECKAYELDYTGRPASMAKKLWNGVASFATAWDRRHILYLRRNEDALNSRDCRALITAPSRGVAVNRFSAGSKTLFHIYNATGHTFAGPALDAPLASDRHLVDLQAQREVRPGPGGAVHLALPRDGVACLARLPRMLSVRRSGDRLVVTSAGARKGDRIALAGAEGEELAGAVLARPSGATEFAANGSARAVLLLRRGLLVDLLPLP
ncbi:MAG: DUF6259 domain-containing protein [Armatimonadetes bacterium]|nr:DUF6259 domain-containing protein [Armatimonadota bacterium]